MEPGMNQEHLGSAIAPAIQLLEVLTALALVLAIAWLVLRFGLARLSAFKASPGGPIQLLARHPLEPRKTLYIVKAGQELLLIGTSESQIHFLAGLNPEAAEAILAPAAPSGGAAFSSVLAAFRKKESRP
jgi:flagellar biosynthetic protein FliO